ncbi:MAG TPA: hypothetical protein PK156_39005 [Polyangium sp.]|nr:hypothetical protein [Polyangium sp.]
MIEKAKFGSLCLGLLMLSACTAETVDSKNIRTGGIVAILMASSTSDSATSVTAALKVGGTGSNTYVDLSGGDRIFAVANDNRVEMEAQGTGTYQTDFNTAAENTEFIVDLQRETDDDAPLSTGLLPGPFTFQVPTMSTSRMQALTITWSPSGSTDDMTMELNGTCIFNRTIDIPGDTGSHMIEPGTLASVNPDKPETCDITVDMKRSRNGTVDAAFDPDSSFVLEQTRTAKFTSAP